MTDSALRRVDHLLTELVELVETARAVPMSSSCVVPREQVLDLLDELREVLPPEMDQARTLIARRDSVLSEAEASAAAIREEAATHADASAADAQHKAEDLRTRAEDHARELIEGAQAEVRELLESGRAEHGRLVSATGVHQAAAQAVRELREQAEQDAARLRGEADSYARQVRSDAERYALQLRHDSDAYAETTLADLLVVLNRAAATTEQGRQALLNRGQKGSDDGAISADAAF